MALATKRKPTTTHKKRHAQHHRRNKHYLKAYFPYIPMLMIIAVGLMVNSLWTSQQVLADNSNFGSTALLEETNIQRTKERTAPLELNTKLSAAAQAKAEDMVKENYWEHTSPKGKTPWYFITAKGYQYQMAGENLAYGFNNAGDTVTGWMNSPKHRANMLNSKYKDVGFGVASSPDFLGQGPKTIIVAEYAMPVGAGGQASTQTENNPTTGVQGSQPITRIEILTGGQATWITLATAAVAGAAFATFLIRNNLRIHRVLVKGEKFVATHVFLDIVIVIIFVAGFLLTRTVGTIH